MQGTKTPGSTTPCEGGPSRATWMGSPGSGTQASCSADLDQDWDETRKAPNGGQKHDKSGADGVGTVEEGYGHRRFRMCAPSWFRAFVLYFRAWPVDCGLLLISPTATGLLETI